MILNAQPAPSRVPRAFDKWTYLLISVLTAGQSIRIGHEQSEVSSNGQNAALTDGIVITQVGTANTPYGFWWKGEFWFTGSQANVTASLINAGEFKDDYVLAPSIPKS